MERKNYQVVKNFLENDLIKQNLGRRSQVMFLLKRK